MPPNENQPGDGSAPAPMVSGANAVQPAANPAPVAMPAPNPAVQPGLPTAPGATPVGGQEFIVGANDSINSQMTDVQSESGGSKRTLVVTAITVVVLAVLGAGGWFGYGYYQKQQSTKKFNQLADAITAQEVAGAKSLVKLFSADSEISDLENSGSKNPNLMPQLNSKVKAMQSVTDSACQDKGQDITAKSIDNQSSGWKLTPEQKRYLSDWKKVLSGLEDSYYSNSSLCSDGSLIVIFERESVALLPGLNVLEEVKSSPSAAQMAVLKKYTTEQFAATDQDVLEQKLPAAQEFFKTTETFLNDYYEFNLAYQNHDAANFVKYYAQFGKDYQKFNSRISSAETELKNFDKQHYTAAINVSKDEIKAIDYQKSHQSVSRGHMQLDYALPSFRIVEATVAQYGDDHDPQSFPHAASIEDLAQLNDNLKQLEKQGHLQGFSYSSSGHDNTGFSLSVKLANGTTLSEKIEPGPQTS